MPETPYVLNDYDRNLRADLEANQLQQEQLRNQLNKLEQEYDVLLKLQKTLQSGAEDLSSLLSEPTAADEARDSSMTRSVRPRRQADVTGDRPKKPSTAARGTSRGRRARRKGQDSLIEVVDRLLREQHTPRSVAEIAQKVAEVRPSTIQTVRNTLDRLVATNKAERTKQGRSVFYSAVRSPGQNPAPDKDSKHTSVAESAG